uniref:Uncharacterized protein n=1 Tax=Arundo donax TaxID=35708 RepID=A0A0A8Y9K4_ARUDO
MPTNLASSLAELM